MYRYLTIIFSAILMFSCGGSEGSSTNNDERGSEEESNETDSIAINELYEDDESSNNDWTKDGLKGEVKKVAIHSVDVDENGDEIGMGGYYEDTEYNAEGLITQKSSSGCCGAMNEEITYKRDDSGKLTHRIFRIVEPWEEHSNETPLDHKEKYFYKNGVLVKMKIAGADSLLTEEHEYKLNDDGSIREEKVSYEDDSPDHTIKYSYSDEIEEEKHVFENPEKNYSYKYFFDENGLMTKQEMHFADGGVQEVKYKYQFDESGNWIQKEHKYRDTSPEGEKDEWMLSFREKRTITYYK